MKQLVKRVEDAKEPTLGTFGPLGEDDLLVLLGLALFQQAGDVAGVVLAVAVHDHHGPAGPLGLHVGQPDGDRPLVAQVAAEPQHAELADRGEPPSAAGCPARERRAVVDHQDVGLHSLAKENRIEPLQEHLESLPIVKDRQQDHDRVVAEGDFHQETPPFRLWHRLPACVQATQARCLCHSWSAPAGHHFSSMAFSSGQRRGAGGRESEPGRPGRALRRCRDRL